MNLHSIIVSNIFFEKNGGEKDEKNRSVQSDFGSDQTM